MANELNEKALGYAAATVSAGIMLLLGILGNLGLYMNGVQAMQKWHVFFSLSIGGIIAGMIEGAIIGFILLYALAKAYNKFV